MSRVQPIDPMFEQLVTLTTEGKQNGFLDLHCPGGSDLRAQLRRLRMSHHPAGTFLENEEIDETAGSETDAEVMGLARPFLCGGSRVDASNPDRSGEGKAASQAWRWPPASRS